MSKKNKILIGTSSVLLVCALLAGFSYAYWRLTYTQTTSNKIATSCFSMELANEKNDITLESAYPISDEKGKTLTPYSFTITNTCDLFASYTINLEMLSGTTLSSKYIKTMINNEAIANLSTLETTDPSIEGATESRILFKGSLGSGDSTDYTFRLWMDSETEATDDSMNKILQAKISVVGEAKAYSPVENGFTLLNEALLVNEYQTISLETAKNNITNKQEVDFTKTAPIIDWQSTQSSNVEKISITKADPNLIGNYGIVEYATKMVLGKGYSFNTETGFYTLEERGYYNPTELNYEENEYYFCGSNITTTTNKTITHWDGLTCPVMYKVKNLSSVEEGTIEFSDGETITSKKYNFNIYRFSEIENESDQSDKGIYKSVDNDGITYYYRGNVVNNYIEFAGCYWRVIRINGDGTLRLLYAGLKNENNNKFSIGLSAINNLRTNPTYVGYMYSSTLDTSYNDTTSNDNDSLIKTKLDVWYKTNIEDTGYSSYIADSGFCNDRSIAIDSPGSGATSLETTYYSTRYRTMNSNPTFICENINDIFTNTNEKGNKNLTYPIGLITIDELMYAGAAYGYLNKMNYTYSAINYWSISPNYYNSNTSSSSSWYFGSNGAINVSSVNSESGVRPVINLKADTEISGGIGTKNDPFIIKTN